MIKLRILRRIGYRGCFQWVRCNHKGLRKEGGSSVRDSRRGDDMSERLEGGKKGVMSQEILEASRI